MPSDIPKSLVSNTSFEKSDVDEVLLSQITNLIYYSKKTPEDKLIYQKFDQDFGLYLNKLPNSPAKKYVSEVFNRGLVYLGITQMAKSEGFFSKVMIDDGVLNGIVVDMKDLDISRTSGETKNIDDCIYAVYYSYIKMAVIANKSAIKSDKKLQELLAQYLYLITISVLDAKANLGTPKQKFFTKIVSYYAFYRYFIKETYTSTIRILDKIFSTDKELYDEFKYKFKDIERYDSIKDIPKMLIDTKISIMDPNVFVINIIKRFKQFGFYSILGSLDYFISFVITCKYPFELFPPNSSLNVELQNKIEDMMIPYMKKVKFTSSVL